MPAVGLEEVSRPDLGKRRSTHEAIDLSGALLALYDGRDAPVHLRNGD